MNTGRNHGSAFDSTGAIHNASDVRAVVGRLLDRRTAIALEELSWRYDLGAMVHRLRYDRSGEFTTRTIAGLGRALNVRPCTLTRYARVAETINPNEFAEYMLHRNRMGVPLTWSHIEELAEVRNAALRRNCAKWAIEEGLSVRDLARRLARR